MSTPMGNANAGISEEFATALPLSSNTDAGLPDPTLFSDRYLTFRTPPRQVRKRKEKYDDLHLSAPSPKFRATPVDKRILSRGHVAGVSLVKKSLPTVTQPFKFKLDERAEARSEKMARLLEDRADEKTPKSKPNRKPYLNSKRATTPTHHRDDDKLLLRPPPPVPQNTPATPYPRKQKQRNIVK